MQPFADSLAAQCSLDAGFAAVVIEERIGIFRLKRLFYGRRGTAAEETAAGTTAAVSAPAAARRSTARRLRSSAWLFLGDEERWFISSIREWAGVMGGKRLANTDAFKDCNIRLSRTAIAAAVPAASPIAMAVTVTAATTGGCICRGRVATAGDQQICQTFRPRGCDTECHTGRAGIH